MHFHSLCKKIMVVIFCLLMLQIIFENKAKAGEATFDKKSGAIKFSMTSHIGSVSSWRYRTVGFIITQNPVSDLAPSKSVPHTDIMFLEAVSHIDHSDETATYNFEIPVKTIQSTLTAAGMTNLVSGETPVYLHAVFMTIPPNSVSAKGMLYTSYNDGAASILAAKDVGGMTILWSLAAKIDIQQHYNIKATYYSGEKDPSGLKEKRVSAKVIGSTAWRLEKNNELQSFIRATNHLKPGAAHIAVRNIHAQISSDELTIDGTEATLPAAPLNGKEIIYRFSYEYTNHYYEKYRPSVTSATGEVLEWEIESSTPRWDFVKTFEYSKPLIVRHQMGERITASGEHRFQIGSQYIVGESAPAIQYESFQFAKQPVQKLETQTSLLLLPSPIQYQNDFAEVFTSTGKSSYFPIDVDENLQQKFANDTGLSSNKYVIPLVLDVSRQEENYAISPTFAEDFYLTSRTGFLTSVQKGLSEETISRKIQADFSNCTSFQLDIKDAPIQTSATSFLLPISAQSLLQPKTIYHHEMVLEKLGLSEITFFIDQPFTFDKFLIGSVFDNVFINEEPAPIMKVNYPHSINISQNQLKQLQILNKGRGFYLNGFTPTDRSKLNQTMQVILKGGD